MEVGVDCRSVLGIGRLTVGRKEGCRWTDASWAS